MRLWSVASHRCLTVFSWFAAISSIAFQRPTIRRTEEGDGPRLAMGDQNGVVSFWQLSAELFREDAEPMKVMEVKTQPSRDDENDSEDEEDSTPQPSASAWRLRGASPYPGMQLWTSGVQLPGCRMSLLSKRLLEQYGADVSEVKVITAQVEEKGVLATLAGLFKRQPHYSNSELLTQADQRVAGMSHAGTRQHYLAKLDYYRKNRDTLSKADRKQLKELIKHLQRLHDNSTSAVTSPAYLSPPDQKHQSKLSFSLKQRLWSSPKPKLSITSSSGASSSSSSSSSMLYSSASSSRSASTSSTSTTTTSHL